MARTQRIYTAQIAVAVTPEMHTALRERAALRDLSLADLVRESVELTAELDPSQIEAIRKGAAEHKVAAAMLVAEALDEYERSGWGVA